MTQKIITKRINHEVLCQVMDFSEVTELVNTIISENPGYNITSSIALPHHRSSVHGGTAISSSIVEYDCTFVLTEGSANQIVVEKKLRNDAGNRMVRFFEVGHLMEDIISEYPDYAITTSVVIEKGSSDLIGRGTIISTTLGYDCCFILTKN